MKQLLAIVFSVVSVLCSCKRSDSLTGSTLGMTTSPDTLIRNIPVGVVVRLDSMKDFYTLDDKINGTLSVINVSDTAGFQIIFPFSPPYQFYVHDETSSHLFQGPYGVSMTEVRETIPIGGSYREKFVWGQNISRRGEWFSQLKAFAGKYYITANFVGNYLFHDNDLYKYFVITEYGDPLSWDCALVLDTIDSLRFTFTVRNRISQDVEIHLVDSLNVISSFVQYPDTVLSQSSTLRPRHIRLAAFSDNVLYEYSAAKRDSLLRDLHGGYMFCVRIRSTSRDLSGSTYVQLPVNVPSTQDGRKVE